MFGKLSRYRKVPDVAAPDPQGRVLAAKDVRLSPTVTGDFRHTVAAGDRLDELAYRYYSQPVQYWHICDANPQFLSPLALVDREPVVTTDFLLVTPHGDPPPWAALLRTLAGVPGVERAVPLEDVEIVPRQQTVDGKPVTLFVEQFTRRVRVTYNRLNVSAEALAARIGQAGATAGPPVHLGQVGQEIVIPPAPIG